MAPSDEDLVGAFQRGERAAFDDLVRRWDRKIQGAVYRLTGSQEEAREVAQETFLRAYRSLPSFKGEARVSSWLYQIALNLCRDRIRRRRVRTLLSLEELVEGGAELAEAGPSAHEIVESADLRRRVADAVASLPEEQREVIVLKEYEGLTFAEIALVLGLPVSTVKTRLYRGLTHLRQRLLRQGLRPAVPAPTT
jgi:RNA polymerase sigma-70 factor (ECF subfamily)